MALVGEPGVGKSRLVWEFTHSHRTQGWLVLESGSVSYGKATSYLPVIDLLKGYFEIEDRDDAARDPREGDGQAAHAGSRPCEPTLPALLALLDVPVDDAAWQALDPPQRRQRTLDAVKRLLLRESQEQPLLLVFEDLHWIDAETQALLDSLVESLPTARAPAARELPARVRARLGQQDLLHASCGSTRCRPRAPRSCWTRCWATTRAWRRSSALLIERTEGNPFFLEESVRTLVETRALAGERGALSAGAGRSRRSRCRRRCRRCWPRASTGCRPRTSGCSRRPR